MGETRAPKRAPLFLLSRFPSPAIRIAGHGRSRSYSRDGARGDGRRGNQALWLSVYGISAR